MAGLAKDGGAVGVGGRGGLIMVGLKQLRCAWSGVVPSFFFFLVSCYSSRLSVTLISFLLTSSRRAI